MCNCLRLLDFIFDCSFPKFIDNLDTSMLKLAEFNSNLWTHFNQYHRISSLEFLVHTRRGFFPTFKCTSSLPYRILMIDTIYDYLFKIKIVSVNVDSLNHRLQRKRRPPKAKTWDLKTKTPLFIHSVRSYHGFSPEISRIKDQFYMYSL